MRVVYQKDQLPRVCGETDSTKTGGDPMNDTLIIVKRGGKTYKLEETTFMPDVERDAIWIALEERGDGFGVKISTPNARARLGVQ